MKRAIRIFVLSKSEQRVVLIVVLALIAGALMRYERRVHQFPIQVTTTTEPKASPNSTEIENER
ncbi:MAG: hypothetical protein E6L08_06660 [Verrucomicrobia bacterium]|nr:MAG: hypothetical protein E6L08_06660 [Verrucomicrobiota bacterium]